MSYLKNNRMFMLLLVAVSLILVPGFANNADGHPGPNNIMISLSDLDDWIIFGYNCSVPSCYPNPDPHGYEDMVIIAVQTNSDYLAGHPTGAYQWEQSVIRDNRTDGLLLTKRQVAFDTTMNDIISKAGIDDQTVVVLTSNNMQILGLAYFSFRYWGWPKERLKVMNGLIKDYISAGHSTATGTSPHAGGSNTVCTIASQNTSVDEVRATVADMMSIATDTDLTTIPLDVRSLSEYNGTRGRNDVAFEGHIRTALWNEWVNDTTTGSASAISTQIKPFGPLRNMYKNLLGLSNPNDLDNYTFYVYCQTATRTGVSFLALDAMLELDVKVYDGSWTEWGNLSDGVGDPNGATDATLPVLIPRSQWALNNSTYTEDLNQNPVCSSGTPLNCGRIACVDGSDNIYNTLGTVALPNQTNENDKQICATTVPLLDCYGNKN